MAVLNLAISCLAMSNLLWFMDLTFQIPVQYFSLQNWTLLSPPETSTTGYHFCFGSAFSFFIELLVIAICSSPVAYWTPSNLGAHLPVSYLFCPFILFMRFLQQEYCSDLPVPPPVDHVLSELSTVTRLSWVALRGMAYSFIELHKPLHHNKAGDRWTGLLAFMKLILSLLSFYIINLTQIKNEKNYITCNFIKFYILGLKSLK